MTVVMINWQKFDYNQSRTAPEIDDANKNDDEWK